MPSKTGCKRLSYRRVVIRAWPAGVVRSISRIYRRAWRRRRRAAALASGDATGLLPADVGMFACACWDFPSTWDFPSAQPLATRRALQRSTVQSAFSFTWNNHLVGSASAAPHAATLLAPTFPYLSGIAACACCVSWAEPPQRSVSGGGGGETPQEHPCPCVAACIGKTGILAQTATATY